MVFVDYCWPSGRLLCRGHLFQDAQNVGLLHDDEFLAVELDFRARPLAEKHTVADLEIERNEFAALVARAGADRDDFALLRFLFDGVWNDDAALGLVLAVNAADDDAVVQWAKFHGARFRSAGPARGMCLKARRRFDLAVIWRLLALFAI